MESDSGSVSLGSNPRSPTGRTPPQQLVAAGFVFSISLVPRESHHFARAALNLPKAGGHAREWLGGSGPAVRGAPGEGGKEEIGPATVRPGLAALAAGLFVGAVRGCRWLSSLSSVTLGGASQVEEKEAHPCPRSNPTRTRRGDSW